MLNIRENVLLMICFSIKTVSMWLYFPQVECHFKQRPVCISKLWIIHHMSTNLRTSCGVTSSITGAGVSLSVALWKNIGKFRKSDIPLATWEILFISILKNGDQGPLLAKHISVYLQKLHGYVHSIKCTLNIDFC